MFGHFGHHHRHGRRFARHHGLGGRLLDGLHERMHGRRGGRMFDQGDLRLVLLQLIAEKPSHGYELIKAIEEKFGGMYSPSPGVIYPTLTLLEEMGFASSEAAGGNRKLFSITDEGRAHLESNRATVDNLMSRLEAASEAYGGGPAPEIFRAMRNLKFALQVRLAKGSLTAEQVRAITESIDRAASEVERI